MEYSGNMYMNHNDPYGVVGLKRAVVVDLNDPKKLNRVKLKFVDENIESVYAPVISSTAGDKFQTVSIPSKNDEVLVGFLDGKIKNPVIIGSLYNSKKKAPLNINVNKNETMVTKLSTGLQITTSVDKKNSSVEIKTKKGNTITLKTGTEQQLLIKGGKKIAAAIDFVKGTIEFSTTGKISFTSGKSTSLSLEQNILKLKSPQIKITADSCANIKANGGAKIEGAKVDVNGNVSANIKSEGITSVAGSILKLN